MCVCLSRRAPVPSARLPSHLRVHGSLCCSPAPAAWPTHPMWSSSALHPRAVVSALLTHMLVRSMPCSGRAPVSVSPPASHVTGCGLPCNSGKAPGRPAHAPFELRAVTVTLVRRSGPCRVGPQHRAARRPLSPRLSSPPYPLRSPSPGHHLSVFGSYGFATSRCLVNRNTRHID